MHGPLLTTLPDEPEWSRDRLRRLLFGEEVPDLQGKGTGGGRATGPLVVANLTVATHLLGTRFVPDLQGAILVLEDVGEAPYRIDRMLTQWRLSGILQQLAGMNSFSALQRLAMLKGSPPSEGDLARWSMACDAWGYDAEDLELLLDKVDPAAGTASPS